MPSTADYICPLCHQRLLRNINSFQCENKHNFDIAKQGYINLLPVQQKKSKNPGDNSLMVTARRDFLDKGHYDLLVPPCIDLINKHTDAHKTLLDIGCGEGYFTNKIFSQINYEQAYGLDISKEAIKIAARRNPEIHWMVASSKDIPLPDNYLSAIVKINAPAQTETLIGKLQQQGIIISVTPGAHHLDGLRKVIYSEAKSHTPEPALEQFVLIGQELVENTLILSSKEDIQRLFFMTPYAWNASREIQQKVEQLDQLQTTVAFQINVWQKQKDHA